MRKTIQLKQSRHLLLTFLILNISCSSNDESNEDPVSTDTIPPSITFTNPTSEDLFTEAFEVIIAANDNEGISKVDLFLENGLVGSDTESPFEFLINIDSYQSGTYNLKGVATDLENNSAESEISIIIAKPSFEAPLALSVSKGEFGNKIALTWNSVNNAANYQVFKQFDDSNEFQLIGTTSENSFEDSEISESLTIFNYKVRVYNSGLEFGEFSVPDYGYSNGNPYDIIQSFGEEGSSENEFGFVALISIDQNDILYLSDGRSRNIKKFTTTGEYQGLFKSNVESRAPVFLGSLSIYSNDDNLIIEDSGVAIYNQNTGTNLVGQFALDSENNLYGPVNFNQAEGFDHHKIYKYGIDGSLLKSFGEKGNLDNQIDEPWGVSIINNLIVVTDQRNKKATFFDTEGDYIKVIDLSNFADILYGNYVKDEHIYIAAHNVVLKSDLDGLIIERIGEGLISGATSVVVDSEDNVIVSEAFNRKIKVLRKN